MVQSAARDTVAKQTFVVGSTEIAAIREATLKPTEPRRDLDPHHVANVLGCARARCKCSVLRTPTEDFELSNRPIPPGRVVRLPGANEASRALIRPPSPGFAPGFGLQ